jgi:hypothetical protein
MQSAAGRPFSTSGKGGATVFLRKKKIAVFSNPHSGKNTPRAGIGRMIAEIMTTPDWTYATSTLGELKQAARSIHAKNPDIVILAGGDGTVHLDLTKILREWAKTPNMPLPHFLLVPGGTMNTVAANLGLSCSNPAEAVEFARRIAYKIEHQLPFDTVHVNPLKVNDDYGFLYGAGLPVNLLNQYYGKAAYRCTDVHREYGVEEALQAKKLPCRFTCRWDKAARYNGICPKCGKPLEKALGKERALQVIRETLWDEIKSLFTFRRSSRILTEPVHAEIVLPECFDPPVAPFMTHTGIMVSSVEDVGMGCRGMPYARREVGKFMLRSTNLSFWGLAANTLMLWNGLSLTKTFDAVVPSLVVKYHEPTVRTLDGDFLAPSKHDRIDCGPLLEFIIG